MKNPEKTRDSIMKMVNQLSREEKEALNELLKALAETRKLSQDQTA